ncbi:hypothetical protein HKBW3S42_02338, partial [Candidatus Hakubella thermalkaliphila]
MIFNGQKCGDGGLELAGYLLQGLVVSLPGHKRNGVAQYNPDGPSQSWPLTQR